MDVIEFFGWAGAILVLIAYFLVSTKKADPESVYFQMINVFGGSFLIIYTYNCNAVASMAVNIIWVVIGLHSISKPLLSVLSKLPFKSYALKKSKILTLIFSAFFLLSNSVIHL